MEIGGRQRGLPVLGVDDLGSERSDRAQSDIGADPRKRGEAAGVVWPVQPVRAEIGVARSVVEMRSVDGEEIEARGDARENARRSPEQIAVFPRGRDLGKLGL